MRTVDKNGVHIEQCEGCRGIFLDRGELEQIAGAESAYYGAPPPYDGDPAYGRGPSYRPTPGHQPHYRADSPQPYRGHRDSPSPYREHADSPRPYRGGYGDSPRPYRGQRKRSFLENLFD